MAISRDPDAALVPVFKNYAIKNPAKSLAAGRDIYDDQETCELRIAGKRDWTPHPVTEICQWVEDPQTGEMTPITYAERFPRQYRQFKEMSVQTKSGTPLANVPFLTEARRAELRALNIYTVEALASIDGQELKNLGQGGRDLKNKAEQYISECLATAPNMALVAELEAVKARNAVLEEDAHMREIAESEGQFAEMTNEQVRDFIKDATGHAPLGTLTRKMLVRIAADLEQKVT